MRASPNLVLPYSNTECELLLEELFAKDTVYKTQSQILAATLKQIQLTNQAQRTEQCNSWKKFQLCAGNVSHRRKLIAANYCKDRFCATCQWLRSRKVFREAMTIGEHLLVHDPKLRFIFLTLTIPNKPLDELGDNIIAMMKAWQRLTQRKRVKDIVLGYHRSLEVTYNPQVNNYHPHFHVLLVVPSSYFKGSKYINQSEWLSLWQEATRDRSINQVNVKAVKPRELSPKRKAALLETLNDLSESQKQDILKMAAVTGAFAECCKYSVKEWSLSKIDKYGNRKGALLSVKDERILRKALKTAQLDFGLPGHIWIRENIEQSGEVLGQLRNALSHRRLIQPGGVIAEAKRELKLNEEEDDIEDKEQSEEGSAKKKEQCSECGCDIVERTAFWASFYDRFTGDKSFQGRYIVPTSRNFELPY